MFKNKIFSKLLVWIKYLFFHILEKMIPFNLMYSIPKMGFRDYLLSILANILIHVFILKAKYRPKIVKTAHKSIVFLNEVRYIDLEIRPWSSSAPEEEHDTSILINEQKVECVWLHFRR